jgi:cardiolipin synthase
MLHPRLKYCRISIFKGPVPRCPGTPVDDEMNQLRATPNQLTFLRLCIVPFLVLSILDGHYRTGFILFVIAGITDGLDGLIARWLKQQTMLGQYLDPVADKLLLSTLFLVLNHQGLIARRITVLVFGRDLGILVVAALLYAALGMRDFRPSIYGKANTLAQIIALVTVLLTRFYAPAWIVAIRKGSLTATMWLTIISGFHYAWRVARRLGQPNAGVAALH